jgi:hydroxymethylpyrimidine/phosphomethylpyrimidine kinase
MLHSSEVVTAVADVLRRLGMPNYVLDPVMVATSGDVLLEPDAVTRILDDLVPLATLVTPNGPEAALLTGLAVDDPADMARAGRALVDAGARAALVKGGHVPGADVVDVLWDGERQRIFRSPRIATRSTHGTGCTLSAAVAAGLARGMALGAAVESALDFVHRAIRAAPPLGRGHGPLSHFVPVD